MPKGVLVESHKGGPTKIEGNPDHPASLGATAFTDRPRFSALYDPDRSAIDRNIGKISSWSDLLTVLQSRMAWKRDAQCPAPGFAFSAKPSLRRLSRAK